MTENMLKKIIQFSTATEYQLELRKFYEGPSKEKIYDLCLQFLSYQKEASDDVATHMYKPKNL